LDGGLFVEPFCGGASVSIALLEADIIEKAVINDLDPLISSLWECVFSPKDAAWLADIIAEVPLTLEHWKYQKNLLPKSVRETALKCLFLNRTSFSGILNKSAGPVGGYSQQKWKLGCRFNREKLSARIIELSGLQRRVTVTQQPWDKVCNFWGQKDGVVFYLDPPFYHKAKKLYRFTFDESEHEQLSEHLLDFNAPWILSYDNAEEIRRLYGGYYLAARIIDNTYSAHPMGGNSFVGREVLYSNFKCLPSPQSNEAKHQGLSVICPSRASAEEENLRTPCTQQVVG
jgi:DNA adenine methylase